MSAIYTKPVLNVHYFHNFYRVYLQLLVAGLSRVASDNLELVHHDLVITRAFAQRVRHFDDHFLDDERPHVVTEPVGIQVPLERESQLGNAGILLQLFGDDTVKVLENADGQLGLDFLITDESIEGIGQRRANGQPPVELVVRCG